MRCGECGNVLKTVDEREDGLCYDCAEERRKKKRDAEMDEERRRRDDGDDFGTGFGGGFDPSPNNDGGFGGFGGFGGGDSGGGGVGGSW